MQDREETFRQFVVARSAALLRLAYLLSVDADTAEDIVQVALTRAYSRWGRIDSNPEAYVRRIVVSVAADERRRPHRRERPAANLADKPEEVDRVGQIDDRYQLRVALRDLPPRQRAAVVLRHWVGLTAVEAADLLGCSPAMVRSQDKRGLESLRKAYMRLTDDARGGSS